MSAEAALIVRSFQVGTRVVTLSVPRPKAGSVVAACFEWAPSVPKKLSAAEWVEYRAGRDAAMAELAKMIGGNFAVSEL